MITLLAADRDMFIAERAKPLRRKQIVGAFRFLKTQNIGLIIAQKLFDQRHAQTNGIDVPGSNGKGHEDRTRSNERDAANLIIYPANANGLPVTN